MRIMIKGGVWKNTEDEILKAAVMKYGKNQWARISSLLVRKSAKQCKARWYEWLDPSIKKTEWTREEDEKLLHLARLMPTQWRTIAPIVGRTPSQCLERYEKLLDAACAKDENYEANDDPRKLRPGEIDPNPESKPARPDPVDMDEDEKEMLSEARARLANTRGKKAKRKAREKQLEEARRLASLQKRRELKAAGIESRLRRRKRRGIDHNAEIPFEKRPPPGFYDTADEDRPVEQPKFPTTIEELEGKRRADVEAQLRKQDIARNKIAQRQDAPFAIMQANKLNDPEAIRKRAKLMLPPPQISDHELEEIAKMGYAGDMLSGEDFAEGSTATRALLPNYSQTPQRGMTPFRTPQRTPGGNVDTVMMEAENLAKLRESQTPLLGGENPELHPSDFSGVTPKKKEIRTPNPMATPLMTPGAMGLTPRIGMTPSSEGYSTGMTPRGTPFRDELRINEDMDMQDGSKLEHRRQAEIRQNLRSGLTGLPLPKNEYQIVIKPIPEENEEVEEQIEEDMSDKLARERAEELARQEALLRKRSKVLQRELPRPPVASSDLLRSLLIRGGEDKSSFVPPTFFEQADELINRELLALLQHDNAKYPLDENADKEKKKGSKRASNTKSAVYIPDIEDFDEGELKEADSLIKEEVEFLRVAMGHEEESLDDFVRARDACQEDLLFFPARRAYGLASVASNSEKVEALQNEFENLKKRLDEEAKKATKSEQKAKVLTHGYQMRAGKLWSQIEAIFKQMDTAGTELECFEVLQRQEQMAAVYRVKYLVDEVNKQKELESTLQRRYGDLLIEYERTQKLVEAHFVELQKQEEIRAKREADEKMQQAIAELQKQEEIRAKREEEEKMQEEIRARREEEEKMQELQKQEEIRAKREEEMMQARAELQKQEEIRAKKEAEEKMQDAVAADNLSGMKEMPETISVNNLPLDNITPDIVCNTPVDKERQENISSKDSSLGEEMQEDVIYSVNPSTQDEIQEVIFCSTHPVEKESQQEVSTSDAHLLEEEIREPFSSNSLPVDKEQQEQTVCSEILSVQNEGQVDATSLRNLTSENQIQEEEFSSENHPPKKVKLDITLSENPNPGKPVQDSTYPENPNPEKEKQQTKTEEVESCLTEKGIQDSSCPERVIMEKEKQEIAPERLATEEAENHPTENEILDDGTCTENPISEKEKLEIFPKDLLSEGVTGDVRPEIDAPDQKS